MSFDVNAFFNSWGGSTTGMSDGSYINKVYIGKEKIKKEKTVSPTGVEYTTAGGSKDKTETVSQAKARYLTDAKLRSRWNTILRQNGLDADPLQARAIWDMAVVGASDWYATSNGQQKVTPEQYVTWYAQGTTKKAKGPTLPTRQIYNVPKAAIEADINEIAMAKLQREIVDADKQSDWYKNLVAGISELYSQGTVSTSKEVINPKTGKKEVQSIQTPKFSTEQITEKITSAVTKADPESAARAARLDFARRYFGGGR